MSEAGYAGFGPYRIHPTQGLFRDGAEVRLTPKSLAVLCVLAARPSEVVTKAELFEAVWPNSVVTDSALSSCIRELRQALGDDARKPRYIETMHGRGFRLRTPSVSGAAGHCTEKHGGAPSVAADFAADQPLARSPSIVVLPFETVGGGESADVLARGITHDVISQVARSRTMLIIARGTAFRFAGRHHDVKNVGRQLRVRYVVQGAVQLSGGRLKMSVALADTRTREELWSKQFQRKLDDWMLLQRELAELIVASLESEVQREETRRALLMPSSNLDAWSAYHRGLSHMYRFRAQDCERAEHWFRRSIEMEPDVPRPYAGLSFVNFERAFLDFDRDRSARVHKAFDYALQSLAIDPRDPMGHWTLSRAHLLSGELEEARSCVETALELNPSYAIAQYSLGWIALHLGENRQCLDRVSLAQGLSPYDPLRFAMLGVGAINLALMGRTAEAARLARQSVRQANAHHQALALAAVIHAMDEQLDRAQQFFRRLRAASPGYEVDDFLAAFPFRLDRDIGRIKQAFADVRSSCQEG